MTVKQAADSLGVKPNAIISALHAGNLKGEKIDGKWEIPEESVEYYREHHRGRQGQLSKEKAIERARLAAQTAAENRRKNRDVKVDDAVEVIWDRFTTTLGAFMSKSDRNIFSQPEPQMSVEQCLEEIAALKKRVEALERKVKEAGAALS